MLKNLNYSNDIVIITQIILLKKVTKAPATFHVTWLEYNFEKRKYFSSKIKGKLGYQMG